MASSSPKSTAAPPLLAELCLSQPACSLSGKTPFTATTVYTCTASRPIWVLVSLFSDVAYHIRVRDPSRGNGRIGLTSTRPCDTDGPEPYEDAQLLRLEPGGRFEFPYTFAVKPKLGGLKHSDVWQMKDGGAYFAELGERKCWWKYADEMTGDLTEEETRQMLVKEGRAERWWPDCKVDFTAVA